MLSMPRPDTTATAPFVRRRSSLSSAIDLGLHQHAVGRGGQFDERAVEIEEKCRLAGRQNSRKCLHRFILPFSRSQPQKCAHLTAHPAIFRESKAECNAGIGIAPVRAQAIAVQKRARSGFRPLSAGCVKLPRDAGPAGLRMTRTQQFAIQSQPR